MFEDIKQHTVKWLRRELHWIKLDYIQARQISNIGLLLGLYNSVDIQGTREALEREVDKEIGRQVKLDLRLRRIKCKSIYGKNATTNIYSVVVDSRQVSEAVKGLRAVLNKTCQPPARRHLSFTTKNSIDPEI